MRTCLRYFWLEDNAQDLVEYSLIIALFVVTIFALTGTGSAAIDSIWSRVNSTLGRGVESASSGI